MATAAAYSDDSPEPENVTGQGTIALAVCLFTLLALAYLWPVWSTTYLPHQDGPTHLYNVKLIRDLWSGENARLAEIYALSPWWMPTWFGHMLIYGLTGYVPYLTPQKILVSVYLLSVPISLAYASRALNGYIILPMIFGFAAASNYLLHMGFYSFCWSVPLAIGALGYWLRHYRTPTLSSAVILSIFGILLYYSHLVSLVATAIGLGLMTLSSLGTERHLFTLRGIASRICWPVLASLPAVGLTYTLLSSREALVLVDVNIQERLIALASLTTLVSLSPVEVFVALGFALFLAALFVGHLAQRLKPWPFQRSDIWFLLSIAWLALYLYAPDTPLESKGATEGGGFVAEQLQLFPIFGLVLWVTCQRAARFWRIVPAGICLALALLQADLRALSYKQADGPITEYVSTGSMIDKDRFVLPVHLQIARLTENRPASDHWLIADVAAEWAQRFVARPLDGPASPGFKFGWPFWHASGYLAIEHGVHTWRNYEANTGFHPLLYRPGANPYQEIGDIERATPDLALHTPNTPVDYVLLWSSSGNFSLAGGLYNNMQGFTRIGSSKPLGLARIYKRNPESN